MLPMARNFYRASSAVRGTVEVILADIEAHGDDAVRQLLSSSINEIARAIGSFGDGSCDDGICLSRVIGLMRVCD